MIRFVARSVVNLLANSIAIIVAAAILDDVSLDTVGFVIAVAVFTVVEVLLEAYLRQTAIRNVPALLGSTALVATLASLIITVLVTDGLSITGTVTWVLATIIVWIVSLVAELLLPLVIFKKVLSDRNVGR